MMTNLSNELLSKDTFKASVSHFKAILRSSSAKPTYNSYGTKFQGCVRFEHFAFYALMRGKSLNTVTHDPNSLRFMELKSALRRLGESGGGYFEDNNLLPSLCGTFDLSQNDVRGIINSMVD